MALEVQQRNQWTGFGTYYTRVSIDDGDAAIISFSKGPYPQRNYPTFNRGVDFRITPAAGGSVKAEYAFRTDYDTAEDDHWTDFDDTPYDTATSDYQDSALSAMRFTSSGSSAVIELHTSTEVVVEG